MTQTLETFTGTSIIRTEETEDYGGQKAREKALEVALALLRAETERLCEVCFADNANAIDAAKTMLKALSADTSERERFLDYLVDRVRTLAGRRGTNAVSLALPKYLG